MGTNSRYGAELGGRVDPNPVALDTQLPPLSSTESLLGSHIALRSIANIGNTAGLLLSGIVPPTWTRYVDLTALTGASFLKHDRFELKYSGSAVFVPSSLPGSPTEGEFVYTTAGHQFQFWNGSSWVGLSSGSTGVASITGTANQVDVSPTTGNAFVSLPPAGITIGPNGDGNVQIRLRAQGPTAGNGKASLWLESDLLNSVGEPGGAYVKMTQDNSLTGLMIGVTQSGALPDGTAYTGLPAGNTSVIAGLSTTEALVFGVNGAIRWQIQTTGALVGGTDPGGTQQFRMGSDANIGGLMTVSGEKNAQVKWSTSPPSGTPPDGTIWIQY